MLRRNEEALGGSSGLNSRGLKHQHYARRVGRTARRTPQPRRSGALRIASLVKTQDRREEEHESDGRSR